ncbi:MAG TPA: dTDP-glucose 4,6-dehydratase [Thermomicrobiales bacterium]|nr:dTDP-glucose 4,6-dehydratase [Thermomicrobiales bacterium]
MHILVTGGAGFIGSHYVDLVLDQQPNDRVTVLDALTYAGNTRNLAWHKADSRFRFVQGSIADAALVDDLVAETDAVVNFAAETHVDRSLQTPDVFLRSNVEGVYVLLDAIRRHDRRMLQVSTDEVYGDIPDGSFSTEHDPVAPRSPYSAAKAGGELFCRSFTISFGTDVVITRGCNTIGPRQYPEKLVPLFVSSALRNEPLPVYGDGRQIRDWLHAADHAAAIDRVLRQGKTGEIYNIGAGNERPNIDVVRAILHRLGKDDSLIRYVPDRPGHDRRYALSWDRIREELGWTPARDFDGTLNETIDWYASNPGWLKAIRDDSPAFTEYYRQQYGWRLETALASPPQEG